MTLEIEYQTFKRELPGLLARGLEGKFVLIKGNQLFGIFQKYGSAISCGYDLFGLSGFAVQIIEDNIHFVNREIVHAT